MCRSLDTHIFDTNDLSFGDGCSANFVRGTGREETMRRGGGGGGRVVFTRENKIEGDPLNTQEEEVVFTRENRGGSAGEEAKSVRTACDVCAAHGDRAAVGVDANTQGLRFKQLKCLVTF